jgi:hypothetical protein
MTSEWTIWVDATTEEKALVLLNRVASEMDREPRNAFVAACDETGGHKGTFSIDISALSWNDAVVEVIDLGQRVGYDWQLLGSILDDAEAISGKTRLSGVKFIQWGLQRE